MEAQPDIVATSLDWNTSTSTIDYTYEVKDADLPGAATGGLYWSSDDTLDPSDTLAIAQPFDLGTQQDTYSESVSFSDMNVSPSDAEYLLLVLDPDAVIDESDEDNNLLVEALPIYKLGAVAHGLQLFGEYAGWIEGMATKLRSNNDYVDAITYHWESESHALAANMTYWASSEMASQVDAAIAKAVNEQGIITPIDVHLIGHSRGAIVVGLVAEQLKATGIGDIEVTMLDPHPARNQFPQLYSVPPTPIGWFTEAGVMAAQEVMQDPDPIANVTFANSYYQQTPALLTQNPIEAGFINLWGASSVAGATSTPPTGIGMGHSEVHEWYLDSLESTSATSAPLLLEKTPSLAQRSPVSATSEVDVLYPQFVNSRSVASEMIAYLAATQSAYETQDYFAATRNLHNLARLVEAQREQHITPAIAEFFVSTAGVVTQSMAQFTHLVGIDIKPGSDTNPVNLESKGKLPVAVLTTPDFDATTIDTTQIQFGDPDLPGRVSPVKAKLEDVDGDGDTDLLMQFSIPDIVKQEVLNEDSLGAELTANALIDGTSIAIRGSNSLVISGVRLDEGARYCPFPNHGRMGIN